MCTVSFIPAGNRFFIAHNRDEKSSRAKALAPAVNNINGQALLFPRDRTAGGAWIGCSQNASAAVLLNGAFEKHLWQPPYRKSRGLIMLDILATDDPPLTYAIADLTGIEPFTMILWSNNALYECRWDGKQKHTLPLSPVIPHSWSSATLYDAPAVAKRKKWFAHWLQQHPKPQVADIIQFHLHGGDGDPYNSLCMNRNNEMLTVSITVMEMCTQGSFMHYLDLQDNTRSTRELIFNPATATP